MMFRTAAALCLLSATGTAHGSDSSHLVVRKNIVSDGCKIDDVEMECVVEGKDTAVSYAVYNVGTSTAFDVKITDPTLEDSFTVSEPIGFTFDRIAA